MANSTVKKKIKKTAGANTTKKNTFKKVAETNAKTSAKKTTSKKGNEAKAKVSKEKTTTTKHKLGWLPYAIIASTAIAIGAGAGIFVKRKFGQEEIDYSNFDASAYAMNSKELLEKYRANPKANFTSAELVNIGLEKYRQFENSYSFTVGLAKTVVDQTIRNAQIKNGDKYFEEQISRSSMVSLANRLETTTDSSETTVYKGKADGDETASYSGTSQAYTEQGFKDYLGRTLQDMFVYTISDDTVYDDSTTETLADGNIRIYLNLDPELSTYFYKIQMKNMSNLDSLPTFNYVKQTYTFTSDMTLLHCYIEEKYQASMGMTVSITNTLHTYYHADEYKAIPTLDEPFDYSTKGETTYE